MFYQKEVIKAISFGDELNQGICERDNERYMPGKLNRTQLFCDRLLKCGRFIDRRTKPTFKQNIKCILIRVCIIFN
jgi:hypothetical protein